jgi:hypothetical protein
MTEEAIAPTTGGVGIKTPSNLDWGQSQDFEQLNKDAADLHNRVYAPIVEKVMTAASGQGTPEDNIEVANVFKTANEARIGDVLAGIFKADPLRVYVGLTGGADVHERGYDGAGNQYGAVYNQRGELRGYKNLSNGKYLTEQELAQIGPITSKSDITAERQQAFKSIGANLADVAKARATDFIKTQQLAGEAGANGGMIRELGAQNNEISKRLSPASLDPKTLALVKGVSSIRTGDEQQTRSTVDTLKQFANGNKASNELSKSAKDSIGLNFGLQYHQGRGWVDSKGNVASNEQLEKMGRQFEESQSSNKAIETRQQDMLQRAQILAAGKPELLNDITALINNNYKIAVAQNAIEQHGGIGVARPNLPQQLGDSFMSARQKAISDEYYGAASEAFYSFMEKRLKNIPAGRSPDIGALRAEFAQSPEMARLRKNAAEQSHIVDKENAVISSEIGQRQATQGLTNETGREAVAPRENARSNMGPQGSRPPVAAPATEAPQRRSLAEIRQSMNR